MTETLLPKMDTPEARQAAIEAVLTLLRRWGLHEAKQAELLGLRDITTVAQSGLSPDDDIVLERAGHLLAIGRLLKRLYADETAADWWITSPYDGLDGVAPVTLMLKGVEGIKRIRTFLEQVASMRTNGAG